MGSGVIDSHHRNVARKADPATSPPMALCDDQPADDPWIRPQTNAAEPREMVTSPGTSSRDLGPNDSGRNTIEPSAATKATGTLTQNTQCHESPWVTAPPTKGPAATPRPEIPPQMPTTDPRRSAGKELVKMVRLMGDNGRAQALDRPRRPDQEPQTRCQSAGRRGHREEQQPHDVQPATSEPIAESRGGDDAGGKRDAVGVHRPLKIAADSARSILWIDGRAVTTTSASRATTKYVTDVSAKVDLRRGRPPPAPAGPLVAVAASGRIGEAEHAEFDATVVSEVRAAAGDFDRDVQAVGLDDRVPTEGRGVRCTIPEPCGVPDGLADSTRVSPIPSNHACHTAADSAMACSRSCRDR